MKLNSNTANHYFKLFTTDLNCLFCLFLCFKFNKCKSLWVSGSLIARDTDINYVATFPKYPFNPTMIDIFRKQFLQQKRKANYGYIYSCY